MKVKVRGGHECLDEFFGVGVVAEVGFGVWVGVGAGVEGRINVKTR